MHHQRTAARFIFSVLAFVLCVSTSHAFRSSEYESYTDPDFENYKPKNVVLQVITSNIKQRAAIEKELETRLKKSGVKVHIYSKFFPPTRTWTQEEQQKTLKSNGVESGLVIVAGASSEDVIQVGTRTFGSAHVSGNANTYGSTTTINANASGSATTMPIHGLRSASDFSAALIDIQTERAAWFIEISTSAGGLLFAGAAKDGSAAAKKIIKSLKSDGHL